VCCSSNILIYDANTGQVIKELKYHGREPNILGLVVLNVASLASFNSNEIQIWDLVNCKNLNWS
jgi:WD40 repeat protein